MSKEYQEYATLGLNKDELLTEEEKQKREKLEVNPFPEILSEEEFLDAIEKGRNFFKDKMKKIDMDVAGLSLDDDFYTALLLRGQQHELEEKFTRGQVTENYESTILLRDNVVLSTAQEKKADIAKRFFENIKTMDPKFDETIPPTDLYYYYLKDHSGKNIIEDMAKKKVWHVIEKLGESNSDDIIGTDTGVFVEDPEETEDVFEYLQDKAGEKVKPTHKWLRKPKTKEEMLEMLKSISGKNVEVVTSAALSYQILKNGNRNFETRSSEIKLPIKKLTDNEIEKFINEHFEEGKNIAGGVDYTTYGKEILIDPESISEDMETILKGTPINSLKKQWARAQIIKRAAQFKTKRHAHHRSKKID